MVFFCFCSCCCLERRRNPLEKVATARFIYPVFPAPRWWVCPCRCRNRSGPPCSSTGEAAQCGDKTNRISRETRVEGPNESQKRNPFGQGINIERRGKKSNRLGGEDAAGMKLRLIYTKSFVRNVERTERIVKKVRYKAGRCSRCSVH